MLADTESPAAKKRGLGLRLFGGFRARSFGIYWGFRFEGPGGEYGSGRPGCRDYQVFLGF